MPSVKATEIVGAPALDLWGDTEETGVVQPEAEMALGEPNRLWGSLSVPEDCLEDRSRLIAVVYCRKVRDGRQSQEKFTVDKRRILST